MSPSAPVCSAASSVAGVENISTLNSRTVAWSAAFTYSDSVWVQMMGAGLATKEIPVHGQYWQTQVLDSSWMSALVQGGRMGIAVMAIWLVWLIVMVLTGGRRRRMVMTGLVTYILIRSVLESGLIDSTPTFVTFFLLSLVAGDPPAPHWRSSTAAVASARRIDVGLHHRCSRPKRALPVFRR